MRWIFVRNAANFAVNFCKKCGPFIFYHRISYENPPNSQHFLQKITQKPRPGRKLTLCWRPDILRIIVNFPRVTTEIVVGRRWWTRTAEEINFVSKKCGELKAFVDLKAFFLSSIALFQQQAPLHNRG